MAVANVIQFPKQANHIAQPIKRRGKAGNVPAIPLEEQVVQLLAGMTDYRAEAWLSMAKGEAAWQRAMKRAVTEGL